MSSYIIVKYIHIVGILVLFAALVLEHVLLKPTLSPAEAKRLAVIDRVYGIAAGVVLGAGLLMWLAVGKPTAFYSGNPVFHAKVGLYVVVALLSIVPTLFFLKASKATDTVTVPKHLIMLIRVELLLMLVIPLLAVTMAQGVGLR